MPYRSAAGINPDAGPYLMTSDREEHLLLEVERLRLALNAVLMAADVREINLVRRIEDVAAEREEWRSRAWAALAGWFTFTFVAGLVVLAATTGVR